MAYPISDVTRRVVYTGSAGIGPYSFSFEVLANTDIQVYKNTTLLTLTTNYTVTINSNGTGSVTLVSAATGSDTITIVGDRAIQRATDFVTGGDLFANTLNDEFDSLVIFAQQVDEKADRGLKAPVTDPTDVNMVLPVKASRKGKVLAFDSTSGDPVAGPALDAVTTVIEQSANINTVATNIASVNTVAGNNTNVTTVAGVSGAVTTVAGISANVTSVAGNSSNINTVAGISANVTTVAGISANVTTVAGISANVTSVAGNSTNINAVAGNSTNINAVNANKTNIDTVAGISSNVTTVATNITAVNSAYTNIAAIIDAPNQATAAANSATAAAASAAAGMYSAVQDKSANYTVVAGDAGDLIRVTTTSGAITITLPTISTVGDGFKVAIVKWTGDANAVSVVRSSTNTINGATSATIGSQYSSTTFVADLETGQWFAVSSGLGASNVAVDAFSGNNSTTAFTLSGDPGSENNTQVFVSGVYQEKDTYSVSGATLTFSTAPPTGTSNIEVVWTAPLAIGTPSDGTVTTAKIADANVTPAKIAGSTDFTFNGLTVGKGGGAVSTNTAVGVNALNGNSTGSGVTAVGSSALPVSTASNNTAVGRVSGNSTTSGSDNTFIGMQSGYSNVTGSSNVYAGVSAGYTATGSSNTFIGQGSGELISTGAKNSILGRYNGNQGGLDIRTLSNHIVLSDGDGNPRLIFNNASPPDALIGCTSNSGVQTATAGGFVCDGSNHLWVTRSGGGGSTMNVGRTSSAGTGALIEWWYNGSNNGTVSTNGTNTSYGTSSDYRLKENISPMTGALAIVAQLKPCTYKWKVDGSDGQGFIAHELQAVVPECVIGEKDAVETYIDDNGNEQTRPKYQGIDTSFLVATLTAAIQEQQATITALTARVTALEGN